MIHLLLAVIYVSFISLGLPDSLLGAAWPSIYQGFGVPVSYSGVIFCIISVGTVLSSLQSDRMTRRFGAGGVTAISVAMTAAALFGFSVSSSFWAMCLWAIPYGLGAGSVDAALNNYVALHFASRHMSWLHCMGDRSLGRALHHGRGAFFQCRVADGVSGHQCDADGADDHYSAEPPALENEIGCECRGAGSSPGKSADPETDFPDLRRKRGSGHIFLLLFSGTDHQSVGQQLSGAEQGNRAGDRRRLCQSFLCRHHRGTGVVRLPDLKIR